MNDLIYYLGMLAPSLFIVVVLIFFFGEAVKLRIKMLGRQRLGYGVVEIVHRNGRRIPYAVKFGREIKIGKKYIFKPKFDEKHVFLNEFGMKTIAFNIRSIEPISIEKDKPLEVGEEHQLTPNEPPKMVVTDPEEDLQSHMAYFQAGLMKGWSATERLEKLVMLCIMVSVASVAIGIFTLYKMGAFG